jgi:YfiH family protein
VYHWRSTHGPVDLAFTNRYRRAGTGSPRGELAFTDRYGGAGAVPYDELNLALEGDDDLEVCAENLRLVAADFAPGAVVADMRQVHGNAVVVVDGPPTASSRPEVDALVTASVDTVLVVRVADCVPVLLADPEAGVIGVVHAGRPGMVAGVAPVAVDRMRDLGAREPTAWLGPRICGACYEVPEGMQAEVGARVPEAVSTTSWGTPALDIAAGVRAQLEAMDVRVVDVAACTRESADLYSYRRDGARAGRFAGLIRRRP